MTISKFLSTAAIIFSLTILGAEAKPPAGSDATNHVNKGVELAQQHQYDEAIKEFTAAIGAVNGVYRSPRRSKRRLPLSQTSWTRGCLGEPGSVSWRMGVCRPR